MKTPTFSSSNNFGIDAFFNIINIANFFFILYAEYETVFKKKCVLEHQYVPLHYAIYSFKGIVSKLTVNFWMCQKCGKMKDYNKKITTNIVE
jgi:hypothetical protein